MFINYLFSRQIRHPKSLGRLADFKESLPVIQKAISHAKFIAIDAEFTGVSVPGSSIHGLDTPEDRYHKCRKVATDYLILQYGLCTFSWDAEQSKYISRPFNFYLFPKQFSRQASDKRFSCQSSCIDFLVTHNFDFNKTFKEGIPYLLPTEENKLRETLEEKHRSIEAAAHKSHLSSPAFFSPSGDPNTSQIGKGPPQIPEEHKDFINNICEKIEKFKTSNEKEMPLIPCNGYLRKLIYLTVAQKYSTDVYCESRTNETGRRHLVVSKLGSEVELRKKEASKRAAEIEELNDAVGFSDVIKMISRSGKLVIGHNMLLDLLYTISHFICPLPEDYEEFKSLVKCVFPRLMDTKYLSNSHPFKEILMGTSLEDLQRSLNIHPFKTCLSTIECAEGFKSYNTATDKYHEAGYDAYVTGEVFSAMSNFLGTYQESKLPVVFPESALLQPFTDKLYLMRIYDIPYINLNGEDLKPERSHVFHLTFPAEWKASDVSNLFSMFGNVNIVWLDDVSAFVSLYKKDNAPMVMTQLNKGTLFHILTYDEFMSRKKDNTTNHSADNHSVFPATSTPVHVSSKRKLPTSDVDLPAKEKRRRSRSSEGSKTSPFASNRSITTIVEEAEEDHEGLNPHGHQAKVLKLTEEDLGSPLSRKRRANDDDDDENDKETEKSRGEPVEKKQKTNGDSDKATDISGVEKGLFDVPDNW